MIKIYLFLVSEHIGKYVLSILLCIPLLALFGMFSSDFIPELLSIGLGFLFSNLLLSTLHMLLGNFEDAVKVTDDTDKLLKIYTAEETKKTVYLGNTQGYVAYSETIINDGYTFRLKDDKDSVFELDDFCKDNYMNLFLAHRRSVKRNFPTIRLDGFEKVGEEYYLYTGRSTYYNHLITNRACDYRLADDLTIRDIYEYGPQITPIEESKMSNHIGVNGLVYLADGELLVPRRKNDSTISKGQITSSLALMLPFPKTGEIDEEYLLKGCIMDALMTRTKLNPEWLKGRIDIEFLGFGRNLYEAGKPQFYFTVRLWDVTRKEYLSYVEKRFNEKEKKIDVDKCVYVVKTDTMEFWHNDEIRFYYYTLKKGEERLRKSHTLPYEKSFVCNIWHEQERDRRKN